MYFFSFFSIFDKNDLMTPELDFRQESIPGVKRSRLPTPEPETSLSHFPGRLAPQTGFLLTNVVSDLPSALFSRSKGANRPGTTRVHVWHLPWSHHGRG